MKLWMMSIDSKMERGEIKSQCFGGSGETDEAICCKEEDKRG